MAAKAFGHTGAARGEANVERAGGRGGVCVAGLGQGCAEFTLHAVAHGAGPVGVAHGGASPAVDDAHEGHHLLNDAQLIVHKHRGRRVLLNERVSVLHHGSVQLGKGQLGVTIVHGHHLRTGVGPVREGRMNQRVSHQSASRAGHGPRCEPRWRRART